MSQISPTQRPAPVARNGFVHGNNYFFYDADAQSSQPPTLYQEILATAKTSIVICDPHYNPEDKSIFESVKQNGIDIRILTSETDSLRNENELKTFVDNIYHVLKKDNDLTKFSICIQSFYVQSGKNNLKLWHDRFLIIDDTNVYLIGSSMQYQREIRKSFGICKIVDKDDIKIISQKVSAYFRRCNSQNSKKISRSL